MVNADAIFIVGTGRSGTHFLTSCLLQHPEITDLAGGEEHPLVFDTATRLATGRGRPFDSMSLVFRYRYLLMRSRGLVFLDQSHPNLWNFDLLSKSFPGALWVGLVRDPRAVVASMLSHKGVRRRSEQWKSYSLPNPFLGISEENLDEYRAASLAQRCAWRWSSHIERTLELARAGLLVPVGYERLVESTEMTCGAVWRQAGLQAVEGIEYGANRESIDKWKTSLNSTEIHEVEAIAEGCTAYSAIREMLGEGPSSSL